MGHPMPVLFALFLAFPLYGPASQASAEAAMNAYDALRSHGLPIGLLPKGVQEFRVDAEGRFEVGLEAACSAQLETEVRYERNVTGALSYGQIASLSGVAARELFLWFPVRAIRVFDPDSGLIFFDVSGIRKQFSLSLFETPPDCTPLAPDHESHLGLDQEDAEIAAVI